MRCPDCQKFVSYDTEQDPEIDLTVDDEGVVQGTARIVNTCAECGTELKEATLDIEIDCSSEFRDHVDDVNERRKGAGLDPVEHVPELVDSDAARTERSETHDRRGREIKSSRYQRRYYGVEVTATLRCSCGERDGEEMWDTSATGGTDVQASGMDDLT